MSLLIFNLHAKINKLIIIIIVIIIMIIIIIRRRTTTIISYNLPETRKYWVDVQRGIDSSYGERDPP